MPDNTSIDPGTTPSVPVAADDIGGVKYQRVKISVGDDGSAVDVGASQALPVSGTFFQATQPVSNASLPLPTGAATETSVALSATALGAPADAAATTTGSVIAQLRRIANAIVAGLPASLGQKTMANSTGVVIASDQSAIPVSGTIAVTGTMPVTNTDLTATGSVTSATTLASITTLNGASTATVQITSAGTTCTITYEATVDGSTWTALNGLAVNGTGAFVSTSTTTGLWQFDTAGFLGFRARVSTYTSGTVTGFVRASVADASFGLDLPLPPGTNTIGALSANQSVSVAVGQQVDGHSATLGATTDAAATTTGSVIAQLRRIANLVAGTLTVSGTVTTTPPSNASTNIAQVAGATVAQGHGTAATALRVELPTDGTGVVGLAAGAATIGALTANQSVNNTQVVGTAIDVNAGTISAGTQRVAEAGANTGTLSNVAASVTSVTVLASNTARRGATIWNDSTSVVYLKFGTTASTTSATVKMIADAYYEVPASYNGRIDGIWVSAAGSARVTEITA